MTAYYNEIDHYAAAWLRNLIDAGHIACGVVDERSIEDIHPSDLEGFTQCHFFAGVGVWSLALRRAGWPDSRPVWTGSCPCQPFSAAGQGGGFDDERHLWPAFHWLIAQRRPAVILGEQVASKDADPWIDLVCADMEALDYAFGAVPFPSAGVGAPHIRDRLYWVAYADGARSFPSPLTGVHRGEDGAGSWYGELERPGAARRLADANSEQRPDGEPRLGDVDDSAGRHKSAAASTGLCDLSERPSPTNGFWGDADWLLCRDGRWRPVSPKPQPLADGSAESLGRVRPEIVAEMAEEVNVVRKTCDLDAALRNLLATLGAQARSCWASGRIPGLHEAPFLLAFLRQLAQEGWRVAQRLPLSCEEVAQAALRGVRHDREQAGTPRQYGLEGQPAGERADPVLVLSSLLARHARAAWDDAYAAYAETGFPLAHGAPARVGRLRAYGNAINAEAARIFIEAVMEAA